MTLEDFNNFCERLPHSTHVVQWRGAHVWKIGDKVFVIARGDEAGQLSAASFKVSWMGFDILKDQPGLQGASHLASRGMSWIQHYDTPGLPDSDLQAYIAKSHELVASGLSKKKQRELGLLAE